MKRPANLDEHAAGFWKRHAGRLIESGHLTDSTFDSFVLLARTYSELMRLDTSGDKVGVMKWIGLNRIYQQLARGFAMNTDKVRKAEGPQELDEFGI